MKRKKPNAILMAEAMMAEAQLFSGNAQYMMPSPFLVFFYLWGRERLRICIMTE